MPLLFKACPDALSRLAAIGETLQLTLLVDAVRKFLRDSHQTEDLGDEITGFIYRPTVDDAVDDRENNGVGAPTDAVGIKIDFDGKEEPRDR